jgi:hypothetical protein
VALTKERIVLTTRTIHRSSSGGKPPPPPEDSGNPTGGSDGGGFPFWPVASIAFVIVLWFAGYLTPLINGYSFAAAAAIEAGVTSFFVIVCFWLFIPAGLLLLAFFPKESGTFLFATQLIANTRRNALRNMIFGGLFVCTGFHSAISLGSWPAVIAAQAVALLLIATYALERERTRYLPQDSQDAENLIREIEVNNGL